LVCAKAAMLAMISFTGRELKFGCCAAVMAERCSSGANCNNMPITGTRLTRSGAARGKIMYCRTTFWGAGNEYEEIRVCEVEVGYMHSVRDG